MPGMRESHGNRECTLARADASHHACGKDNGMVVKELIIDIDDTKRRVAWSAVGGRLSHHNASMQIFADGDGTKAA